MAANPEMATLGRRQEQSAGSDGHVPQPHIRLSFAEYDLGGCYDEMFDEGAQPRQDCGPLYDRIRSITADDLTRRQRAADRSMMQLGITFAVYGDRQGAERIIP